MNNCAVIIPALNPPESLVEYVKSILARDIRQVIVVNDGSKKETEATFETLSLLKGCTVLTHNKNEGKGRALKTAFGYFLQEHSDFEGVITADADGQHSVPDVVNIAAELGKEDGIILGVRDFSRPNVPIRSYIGNRFTSFLFKAFYGGKLEDTQTGLRGIPTSLVSRIIHLNGERYEYELNMLIFARNNRVKLIEIPIQTLYFNNNSGSHYSSFKDSLRVLMIMVGQNHGN